MVPGREDGQIAVPNVGYARVSTIDQDPTLQLDALAAAGCAKVFEDCASGARADRAGLRSALEYVRDGDVLIVWKLDRLGRSLPHLIETVTSLATRGVGFRSITEAIDTTTPGGRLVFHLFGALGEYAESGVMQSDVIGTPNHLGSGGVLLRIIPGLGRGLPSHAALRCGRGGDCGGAIATCRAN